MVPPSVELRSVHVFLVLAEELHFARTADEVGLTPSRISQIVRELERRVGGSLFQRSSRRVRLTPLGERLREHLAPLYAGMDEAFRVVREHSDGVTGALRVGSYLMTMFGPEFDEVVRAFENAHPDATLDRIDIGLRRNPLDVLRAGDVDALVMRLPISDSDLIVGPRLTCEDRIAIVARNHPLAHRTSIQLEDLGEHTVNDLPSFPREVIEQFVPSHTPSGRPIARTPTESVFDSMALVVSGRLVHLGVPSRYDMVGHPDVVAIPVIDLPPSESAFVWRRKDDSQPAIRALAELAEHAECARSSSENVS